MDNTREVLAQADRHVFESRQRIAKQLALIKQLERDGYDSAMAKALLQEFRHSLRLHLIARATIEAEIARTPSNLRATVSTQGGATMDSNPTRSDERGRPPRD
jgi:hypothetical protein